MPILSAGTFVPAPEGQHQAILVDIIDLGELDDGFGGRKPFIKYVFQLAETMDNGKPYVVSSRFNATLHNKGKLRPFIQSMRGKTFTAEELKGFDDEELVGKNYSLNVIHNVGKNGGTYANIASVAPWNTKFGPEIEPSKDYVRAKDRDDTFTTEDGGKF
jgi:hypothetical protein